MGINGPRMGMNGPRMGMNGPRMSMNRPRMGMNGPQRGKTFLLAGIRYIIRFSLDAVVIKMHFTNIFKNELTTCPKSKLPKMHMIIPFYCYTNGGYIGLDARKPVNRGFRSVHTKPSLLSFRDKLG